MDTATTYLTVEGLPIQTIQPTVNSGGQFLNQNFQNIADIVAVKQSYYCSAVVDLAVEQDVPVVTVPEGHVLFVDGLYGAILTCSAFYNPSTYRIGNTTDLNAYCVYNTADSVMLPQWSHDEYGYVAYAPAMVELQSYLMLAVPAGTTVTAGIVSPADAEDYTGRFIVKGLLIPT